MNPPPLSAKAKVEVGFVAPKRSWIVFSQEQSPEGELGDLDSIKA